MSWFRTRPAAPIIRLYPFTACGLLMVREPTSDRSVLRPAMLLSSAEMACFSGGDALPVVAGGGTGRPETPPGPPGFRLLRPQGGQIGRCRAGEVEDRQQPLRVDLGLELAGWQADCVLNGLGPGEVDGVAGRNANGERIQPDQRQNGDDNDQEGPQTYGPAVQTHGCGLGVRSDQRTSMREVPEEVLRA